MCCGAVTGLLLGTAHLFDVGVVGFAKHRFAVALADLFEVDESAVVGVDVAQEPSVAVGVVLVGSWMSCSGAAATRACRLSVAGCERHLVADDRGRASPPCKPRCPKRHDGDDNHWGAQSRQRIINPSRIDTLPDPEVTHTVLYQTRRGGDGLLIHTTGTAGVRRCRRGAATAVTERLCQCCCIDGGDGGMPSQPFGQQARQWFELGVGGLTVALAPIAHRRMRDPDDVGDLTNRHAGQSA